MLSAQVTPWLQPFVSYSKSMRGPNIQEVFFANSGGQSMNPFLKGEKAETWQGGFNANAHDLLFKQDSFQLKAVYFETRIKTTYPAKPTWCVKPSEVQPFAGDAGRVG